MQNLTTPRKPIVVGNPVTPSLWVLTTVCCAHEGRREASERHSLAANQVGHRFARSFDECSETARNIWCSGRPTRATQDTVLICALVYEVSMHCAWPQRKPLSRWCPCREIREASADFCRLCWPHSDTSHFFHRGNAICVVTHRSGRR